jgi:tRNA A37 threonylcarbamoyladenosine biosynthesis protein TsaE
MADQLAETIEDRRAVVVVEWADIVDDVLPKDRISIEFKPAADEPDERNISISYPAKYSRLIKRLETDWAESRP